MGDGGLYTLGAVPHLDQAIFMALFVTLDNKHI